MKKVNILKLSKGILFIAVAFFMFMTKYYDYFLRYGEYIKLKDFFGVYPNGVYTYYYLLTYLGLALIGFLEIGGAFNNGN